jgi:hypothetical protein
MLKAAQVCCVFDWTYALSRAELPTYIFAFRLGARYGDVELGQGGQGVGAEGRRLAGDRLDARCCCWLRITKACCIVVVDRSTRRRCSRRRAPSSTTPSIRYERPSFHDRTLTHVCRLRSCLRRRRSPPRQHSRANPYDRFAFRFPSHSLAHSLCP